MSKKYSILALIAGIFLWISWSANPPDGKTGAPGDGICSECHNSPGSQQGSITVAGLPALIQPNTAYVLTITNALTSGTAALAGMQMTVLNSNNQKAGNMTGPTNQAVVTNSGNGRQYLEHDPALAYPGNNMVVWTVIWTAPAGPANTMITAYAAGNVANGTGGSGGDLIVTTSATGMLNGGGNPLSVQITSTTNVSCAGGGNGSATALAAGGTSPYTYNWSNGGSGPTINNLTAGNYTVTVTDSQSSTATAVATISQPTALLLQTPTIVNVLCNGGNNGSITANPSGATPPYSYAWSNGGSTQTISNLTAGSYSLVVTDFNGCTKTANYMVTQPAAITINLTSLMHESCAGAGDGAITIATAGGVGALFAEWSNGTIGNTNANLTPGAYSVTVTDNNNCTKTASYTINPGGMVNVTLQNIQQVTCNGGSNGAITVTATGAPPIMFNWSNGASGPMITNLAAGNYLLTATDNNGCEAVKFYTITQPPPIAPTISQADANLCFGDANVDLTVTPTGGLPPFTGVWSTGASGLTIMNVGAGNYSVTVTDANGCSSTGSALVTAPPLLTLTVTTTDETGVGTNDGTATAVPGGGTPGYTYLWNNGATTSLITGLAPGNYTVTVTDANGCSNTASGQVDAFGCQLDVTLPADQAICPDASFVLLPSVNGNTGIVTFLWSTGDTTETIQASSPGEYCLTVTDEAGCQDADCIVITQIVLPPLNCIVTNESAPGQNDGSVSCDTLPGIVAYLWNTGATTPSITGLAPGVYCLTVTDVNGCTKSDCFVVQAGNCQLVVTSVITDVLCHGQANGVISVSVENATPPVNYNWSTGDTTSTISNLAGGNYNVTITDASGCLELKDYIVSEPDAITITVDSVFPVSDAGLGFILITVGGGVPPYSYAWTDPLGNANAEEDQLNLTIPGNYQVTVTDANGCGAEVDSIFVANEVATGPTLTYTPLKIYPVPAGRTLYLDMDAAVKEVVVNAIDGRRVLYIKSLQANALDVSGLDTGWYVLRISDGQSWYIARFIK